MPSQQPPQKPPTRRSLSATHIGRSNSGRSRTRTPRAQSPSRIMGRTGNGQNGHPANENTPLLPSSDSSTQHHHKRKGIAGKLESFAEHDNRWIRYPSKVAATTWAVLCSNYANILLVFVPLGIVAGAAGWDPVTVFVLNFLAIVPLAGLLAFATEELAAKLGETIGGLLNATFGNAVELIVSIVALRQGQIRIVQASMLGSILSNLLLVLGCCFLAGGIKTKQSEFNPVIASTMSSLMAVASASLVIPATLYSVAIDHNHNDKHSGQKNRDADNDVQILSRGTSIILLFLYVLYLYFQLRSHAYVFDEESNDEAAAPEVQEDESDTESIKEGETLSPIPASIALVIITVAVAICAEYLVDSIDAIVERVHISKTFIGLILLPIVGNAAEHVTAVVVSYKNKMNLALGVAVGSSLQIALFVTPFLVVLGWAIGQPMTLRFEPFETVIFFLSVLIVNYLIQDGKSNYLEGAMCLGMYAIIAIAFYVLPENASSDIGSLFRWHANGAYEHVTATLSS